MHIAIWKLYVLRAVSLILMIGGPFFMRYFDERDSTQRIFKMILIVCIPMGFMLLMLSFYISSAAGLM